MRSSGRFGWFLVIGSLLLPPGSPAQTAQIAGRVTDASGAVVPGVEITASNADTGLVRRAESNALGYYVVPMLPNGPYRVTAIASGFRPISRSGIRLEVDQHAWLELTLTVDTVRQTIEVPTESAFIDTRSGALASTMDAVSITSLPLDGRNPIELQYLVAGVGRRTGVGQAQNRGVSVNGSRPNMNNYTLDGGDNHDPYFNTPAIFPSPDALEEFTVQTNAYAADAGRNAGIHMSAVTRSGTNSFHGALFEFLRNEKLNARNFFANEIPPFKRNQFGGTFGGPVKRNRAFFFLSYQRTTERSAPAARTATVLSAAERRGDFAASDRRLEDPDGGYFPANRIPAHRLHPASQGFLEAFVPLPNRPGGMYSFASQAELDEHQAIGKFDYQFGSANRLTSRFIGNHRNHREATGSLPGFFAGISYQDWNWTVSDTHVFDSSTINRLTVSYTDIHRVQSPVTPGGRTWNDFGANFTRTFEGEAPAAHDTLVSGYFQAFSRFPLNHDRGALQISDAVSLMRGAHLLRVGGDVRLTWLGLQELFQGDPMLRFRDRFTGNAAADFLLGRPHNAQQIAEDRNRPRSEEYALFVHDDWQIARRLTLNLGLRWEPYLPFIDRANRFAQVRPGEQSLVFPAAPPGLIFPGDPGVSRSTIRPRWNNLAPRFGFAFDPTGSGKTALRGGYGLFYSQIRQQAHNQISTTQPFSIKLQMSDPPGGLDAPYLETGNPFPFVPPATAEERARYQFLTPVAVTQWDPNFRNAIVQQWNFNIQHELFPTYRFTLAYVGNKGNHLFMMNERNPGRFGAPGATLNERRSLYPHFGAIPTQTSEGNSTYHALQATLDKRFSGGFSIQANYTFGKLLDNASADDDAPANPFDIRNEKGHSDLDITHRLVGVFVWRLPRLQSWPAIWRAALGDWETNGVLVLESGQWLTVVSGRDNSGAGVNQDRADLTGNPRLDPNRERSALIAEYFNTRAFAVNSPGTFGTAGRNIIQGPGLADLTVGISKNIRLAETHALQFRAECFNLLNQVNLGNPSMNVSSAGFGRITSAGDPRVVQLAVKYSF